MDRYVTLVLTIFVAAIAFLQWRTARKRLSLDLYNKIFNIYVTILDLYQTAMKKGVEEMESAAIPFIRSFRESLFLFSENDGIHKTLENIKDAYSKIVASEQTTGNPHILEAAAHGRKDFETLLLLLEKQLATHLDFRKLK